MDKKIELSLYVYGLNSSNNRVIARLIKTLDDQLRDDYKFNVYDLKKDPVPGLRGEILVTPTLVRDYPEPNIKITGDLENTANIMLKLELLGGK